MSESNELMKVVTVGGNSVSAFLSWRLQATNACDVTLVWKTGYEHVAQYGISFKYVDNAQFEPSFSGRKRIAKTLVPTHPDNNADMKLGLRSLAMSASSLVMVSLSYHLVFSMFSNALDR